MSSNIGHIGHFDDKNDDFESYSARFSYFIAANVITEKDKAKALFCTCIGPKTFKVLQDIVRPKDLKDVDYTDCVQLLKDYYRPVKNVIYESYLFNSRIQKESESVNQFYQSIQALAKDCQFGKMYDRLLRDRFVAGLSDKRIQNELFTKSDITLKDALTIANSMEITRHEVDSVNRGKSFNVNAVSSSNNCNKYKTKFKNNNGNKNDNDVKSSVPSGYVCFSCGSKSHYKANCKFKNAKCFSCGRIGHVSKVCKMKGKNIDSTAKSSVKGKTHHVADSGCSHVDTRNSCIEYSFSIGPGTPITQDVVINGKLCTMELDTGSSRTIVPMSLYNKLFHEVPLDRSTIDLKTYGNSSSLNILGKGLVDVSLPGLSTVHKLELYVVKESGVNLLGRAWLDKLGFSYSFPCTSESEAVCSVDTKSVLDEFGSLFEDKLGKFTLHKVHIDVDQSVAPKFCKSRPVPFKLREKVDSALDKLVSQGVIEAVSHSQWAAPVVPVMKPDGSVRICGDFRLTANKAVLVDSYPMPKPEELFSKLAGGVVFSKLDMSQAYQQLELDDASKALTTINTNRGLFRYNRLCFGISAAPGIFQRTLEGLLREVSGVSVYLDDILLCGKDNHDHARKLRQVLNILQKAGFVLKKDKCEIGLASVSYLGFVIDREGLRPNPLKIKAIMDAPAPKDLTQLRSYLGMINFYRKFLRNAADLLEPLNRLLRNDNSFHWGPEQENAFVKSKSLLVESDLLVHFDPSKPIVVTVDSSSYGIGAVLSHVIDKVERPVFFISRSLNDAERKYSQIEREALALVFGLKRFHYYLFGQRFTAVTDHLPLLSLFSNTKNISSMASGRIQRWSLMLSCYSFNLIHRSGKTLGTADTLSRLPLSDTLEAVPVPAEWMHFVHTFESEPVNAATIRIHTAKDPILSDILRYCVQGFPNKVDSKFNAFFSRRNELVVQHDCLLWGNRVIVPSSLRKTLLDSLHSGHVGMTRMKELARSYFWWPGLDSDIEQLVGSCDTCLRYKSQPKKAPLHAWEWPSVPWHRLHIDYAGPVDNYYFLIIVDAHSKWLEIYKTKSMTSQTTISCLRNCFSRFGLPVSVVSDNGPCFISSEFAEFMTSCGVKHILSAPYHPSTNGQAENAVRTFKDYLKTNPGSDMQTRIDRFLYRYRITPHSTTGVSPCKLLLGREVRSLFDLLRPKKVEDRVFEKQKLMAKNHDPLVPRNFSVSPNDSVMVKSYSPYSTPWIPAKIVSQTGPLSYSCDTGDKVVRRHQDQILIPSDTVPVGGSSVPSTPVVTSPSVGSSSVPVVDSSKSNVPVVSASPVKPVELRRSGRIVKAPDRLNL